MIKATNVLKYNVTIPVLEVLTLCSVTQSSLSLLGTPIKNSGSPPLEWL